MCSYNNILQLKIFRKIWIIYDKKIDFAVSEFYNFWLLLLNWPQTFLMGWLLVLGLKESLLEYATVCVKSEIILRWVSSTPFGMPFRLPVQF